MTGLPTDFENVSNEPWTETYGSCLKPRDNAAFTKEWTRYRSWIDLKLKANSRKLGQMPAGDELAATIQNLFLIEPVLRAFDSIRNSAYLRNLNDDPHVVTFSLSPVFLSLLADPHFAEINADTLFNRDYHSDQSFRDAIDRIGMELRKPEVFKAAEGFRKLDIPLIRRPVISSGLRLVDFYRKKGIDPATITASSFLSQMPYPETVPGVFAAIVRTQYRSMIPRFLFQNKLTADDVQKTLGKSERKIVLRGLGDNGKDADAAKVADALNEAQPPVNHNAYDEYVHDTMRNPAFSGGTKITLGETVYDLDSRQQAAIDGVARTLWGEASLCQARGTSQFQAIGLVIANRVVAVEQAAREKIALAETCDGIEKENADIFLSPDPVTNFKSCPQSKLNGENDFGRNDTDAPIAAQVVSRSLQFSVWNAYSISHRRVSHYVDRIPKNIPNVSFPVKGPRSIEDEQALLQVLCPSLRNTAIWKQAVYLAAWIVADPKSYRKNYRFEPNQKNIFYYTHGPDLPFARERDVKALAFGTTRLQLKGAGGSCDELRFFMSRPRFRYGLD